jgi:hypothetical protein
MSFTRIDNDYLCFLEAQEQFRSDPKARGTLEITSSAGRLLEYIEPMKLQGFLDRIAEFRFEKSMRQFLEQLGDLDSEFLDHLTAGEDSNIRVLSKGADLKVSIEGLIADLLMWIVPAETQMRELYNATVADVQGLDLDNLVREGVRRFQVKGDWLRNAEARYVDAGTRFRYSYEWHSLLLQMAIGDQHDLLLGTTNVGMAMAFGLPLVANREDRRVHSPSVRELESILEEEGKPVVVTGVNGFQIAHLYGHVGDSVTFEWDRDFTGDMGPSGRFLPLESTIVPKSE